MYWKCIVSRPTNVDMCTQMFVCGYSENGALMYTFKIQFHINAPNTPNLVSIRFYRTLRIFRTRWICLFHVLIAIKLPLFARFSGSADTDTSHEDNLFLEGRRPFYRRTFLISSHTLNIIIIIDFLINAYNMCFVEHEIVASIWVCLLFLVYCSEHTGATVDNAFLLNVELCNTY